MITATDNISGINSIKYSYVKADGVSGVNSKLVDEKIEAASITSSNGGAVGTATFEILRSALAPDSQFNSTVNLTAKDRANNTPPAVRVEDKELIAKITFPI